MVIPMKAKNIRRKSPEITEKYVAELRRRNVRHRESGTNAADAAVRFGVFAYSRASQALRNRSWVAGYAFFRRLFESCRNKRQFVAACEAFDRHPPKCPPPMMAILRSAAADAAAAAGCR